MRILKQNHGFSLIELLTVIAIIALLAAIIFPVMNVAKNNAHRAQCMSNLYHIGVAEKQFFLDEHRYADFVCGPVEWSTDGLTTPGLCYVSPSNGGSAPNQMLPDNIDGKVNGRNVSLYPEYIKTVADLTCPYTVLNGATHQVIQNTAVAWPDPLIGAVPTLTSRLTVPDGKGGQTAASLYPYSAYDIQVPPGMSAAETHYSIQWVDATSNTDPDYPRQMHWRNPPENTVVTWCSYHRDVNGNGVPNSGSKDLVLFLDGHVKLVDSRQLEMTTPRTPSWLNGWKAPYIQ
jgi:prepilin-type N-terminal cleavage/methylation domain-containing protein